MVGTLRNESLNISNPQAVHHEDPICGLLHFGSSSCYRFFFQENNVTHSFCYQTERMFSWELFATLLGKGKTTEATQLSSIKWELPTASLLLANFKGFAQHSKVLEARLYIQLGTAKDSTGLGLLCGSWIHWCKTIFQWGSLQRLPWTQVLPPSNGRKSGWPLFYFALDKISLFEKNGFLLSQQGVQISLFDSVC